MTEDLTDTEMTDFEFFAASLKLPLGYNREGWAKKLLAESEATETQVERSARLQQGIDDWKDAAGVPRPKRQVRGIAS